MFFTWKHRFMVLVRSRLYWFISEDVANGPTSAKGSFQIAGARLRALDSNEISGKPYGIGLTEAVSQIPLVLIAPNEEIQISWLEALLQAGAMANEDSTATASQNHNPHHNATLSALNQPSFLNSSTPISDSNQQRRLSGSAATTSTISPMSSPNTNIGPIITPTLHVSERMFMTSTFEGWLLKVGGVNKNKLQPRYFVLLYGSLLYFTQKGNQDTAKGAISLKGAFVSEERLFSGHQFVFSLTPKEKPRSSLFSSLFGEVLKKYILVAHDLNEMRYWMKLLQTEIARADSQNDEDDNADLSDEEVPDGVWFGEGEGDGSDNEQQKTNPPFTPSGKNKSEMENTEEDHPMDLSTFDAHSHCYKLDGTDDVSHVDSSSLSWKKRFFALDVKSKSLHSWRHKPTKSNQSKSKLIDLSHGRVRVNDDLKCAKVRYHPCVLTLTFATSKSGGSSASSSSSPSIIHLVPSSKRHFDEWYSVLLVTLGKKRNEPSATSSSNDSNDASNANSNTDSSASYPSFNLPPHLLDNMSLHLSDSSALDHFTSRCNELVRGNLAVPQFFRSFFRLFGREGGSTFWPQLLASVPREEIRIELEKEMERNLHHFTKDAGEVTRERTDSKTNRAGAAQNASTPRSPHHDPASPSSTSPPTTGEPPNSNIPLPNFGPSTSSSSTPHFSGTQSSAASSFPPPVSPSPSPSPSPAPPSSAESKSKPKSESKSKPSESYSKEHNNNPKSNTKSYTHSTPPHSNSNPNPNPSTASTPSSPTSPTDLRDQLSQTVNEWNLRGEGNILTLLCTLHDVLPTLVTEGQFIPFDDGYPNLKQVKQTYFKSLLIIHPDKQKATHQQTVRAITSMRWITPKQMRFSFFSHQLTLFFLVSLFFFVPVTHSVFYVSWCSNHFNPLGSDMRRPKRKG